MGQKVLEAGTKIRVIDHNGDIPYNTFLKIKEYAGTGRNYVVSSENPEYDGDTLSRSQFEVINSQQSVFEKEKAELERQAALLGQKIKFMVDNQLEEYDELEFKAWAAVGIVDDDKSNQYQKAQALATVVRG